MKGQMKLGSDSIQTYITAQHAFEGILKNGKLLNSKYDRQTRELLAITKELS
jgi:hypothetical protein